MGPGALATLNRKIILTFQVMMSFLELMNSHHPVVGLFQASLIFNPFLQKLILIQTPSIRPRLILAMDF